MITSCTKDDMTLQEWWDYVKTDDTMLKTRYFLRNYSGMGYGLKQYS